MIPGTPLVVHCPHCEGQVAQPTLASGNTFGATLWSDAKQVAPMLPHFPDLSRCPHCLGLFRASTATQAEEQPTGWSSSFPSPPELSEDNWLDALDANLFAGEDERYARFGAWHTANDRRRGEVVSDFEFSPRAVHNLETLRASFAESVTPNDQLLVGEILRELHQFAQSIEVLNAVQDEEVAGVRDQILKRAQSEDASVFEIRFD